ncbi:MAG: acyloxyacyl hydrolase [Lysobacterales bacterium]|nr:MAG: acyloxyacyl hydrolase [Xanthomonadales bacterium]
MDHPTGAVRALALAAVLTSAPVFAVDRITLEFGAGDDDTPSFGVAVSRDWDARWFDSGDWYLGGYWELGMSRWFADDDRSGAHDINQIGLTPVFRLQERQPGAFSPYAEIGIGVHFLSSTRLNDERKFGSSFQFGDHVGIGFTFGPDQAYDLGYRFQHLSNAGLNSENSGINFHELRFGMRLP